MTRSFITEFYKLNDKPVMVVMLPDRTALQVWFVDRENKSLKRSDSLMHDIEEGRHQGQISADDFSAYCKEHGVNTAIPDRSLHMSFRLAERGNPKHRLLIPNPPSDKPPLMHFAAA